MITKKRIFIAIAAALLLVFPAIGLLLQKKNTDQNLNQNIKILNNGTKPSLEPARIAKLEILSVAPADGAGKVPLDARIEITFDKPDTQNDTEFSIHPQLLYDLTWKDNKMIVSPRENYGSGTVYTYIIKYQSTPIPSQTYTFTTIGKPVQQPDTQPEGGAEFEKAFQRELHPDVYLSNNVPYSSDTFSVTGEFTAEPEGHFKFSVNILKTTGQEDFIAWLKTLLLTDEQIASLDIIYE